MTPQVEYAQQPALSVWTATQERPCETRTITRHPIVNQQGRVQGYELLFGIDARGIDDSEAALTIIDDLVLFGYDRLTRGLPAFIRCSADVFADGLLRLLPPRLTVVEIPQSLHLTPRLIEACWELRQAGFRLALVDCLDNPEAHPLLELVDYVRLDPICIGSDALKSLRQHLQQRSAALIAEDVQSNGDLRQAVAAGFTSFQGPCFSDGEPLRFAKVPANRAVHVEILEQLFADPLDLKQLCPLVMRDPGLLHRLFRLVNSPVCASRRKVDSVQAAILYLGEDVFRRAALLAIRCELNAEQPQELTRKALVRARFCELAAPLARLNASEQYLLGIMSLLPEMLRSPMTAVAGDLPLRPAVVEALQGAAVPERKLLDWVEALERNHFAECYRIADINRLDHYQLDRYYLHALASEDGNPAVPE